MRTSIFLFVHFCIFRAQMFDDDIELMMQINELRMPPNSRRVTYEITPEGAIIMVKS